MIFEWFDSQGTIDWHELSMLYALAPLGDKKPEDLKVAFSNSKFKCFIFESQKLIGVGRALADGVDCSYICGVAVLPEYQGYGLGKEIVLRFVALSKGHKKLSCTRLQAKSLFTKKWGLSA